MCTLVTVVDNGSLHNNYYYINIIYMYVYNNNNIILLRYTNMILYTLLFLCMHECVFMCKTVKLLFQLTCWDLCDIRSTPEDVTQFASSDSLLMILIKNGAKLQNYIILCWFS